jgi:UDP-N-acetylglucosamine:LPS N-acetylglucosamine transferase
VVDLLRRRPRLVLSAGTALAVPWFVAARLLGIPTVWVETLNLVDGQGRAARICARLSSAVAVQRSEQLARHRRGVHVGELY